MNHQIPSPCYRIQQAVTLYNICTHILNRQISIRKIAKVCMCDQSTLTKRIHTQPKPNGRPQKLSREQEEELVDLIELYSLANRPVSVSFLRQYIFEQFQICVSVGWYSKFLQRHTSRIRKDIAIPQESLRLRLPIESAEEHVQNLKKYVNGIPTELIFNIDEVGCQKWADRKKKKVIVSQRIPTKKVFYSVKRSEKRLTVVSAISMAGDVLVPLVISQRKTFAQELIDSGIREGEDFIFKHQKSAFINKEIFGDYIRDVVFPYIDELRKHKKFENEMAVILCDNCSSHVDDVLYEEMAKRNIRFITFPPHSSHLFQPLDLVTFGIFKMKLKTITDENDRCKQAKTIDDIICALESATISKYNRSAFKRAGLKIDTGCSPHRCTIDEQILRQRIEEANLQQGEPNMNRSMFGFMNKKFF